MRTTKAPAELTTPTPEHAKNTWPDGIISASVLALTTAALLAALQWPIEAAIFPMIASSLGILCSGVFLLKILLQSFRRKSHLVQKTHVKDHETHQKNDEDRVDVEYVFGTAGKTAWLFSLGWITVFLLLMYLFGILIAGAAVSLFYLRLGAKRSWLFSSLYTVFLTAFIWFVFEVFLRAALPEGIVSI